MINPSIFSMPKMCSWCCHNKICWDTCFKKISQNHQNVDLTFLYRDYNTTNYGFMKSHFSIHGFFINLLILLYFKQITIQFLEYSSILQKKPRFNCFFSLKKLKPLLQSLILGYEPINSCGEQNGKAHLPVYERVILNSYLIPAKLHRIWVIVLKMFK